MYLAPRIRYAQHDVEDFHNTFRVEVGEYPAIRAPLLRRALIMEEITELVTAIAAGDLPGAVDGIIDAIYVLLGTAVTFGVDIEPIWMAVHRSNMAKIGGTIRADGKVLKPAGWIAPDIESELERQGWLP